MARRKNPPESVRMKCSLAERLRIVRTELYGERGGPELARRLRLPIRTWYNYEGGVTVPGEVLLRFVELTSVEPMWLLYGRGPKFRTMPPLWESGGDQTGSVEFLLRAAIQRLEQIGDRHRVDEEHHDDEADYSGPESDDDLDSNGEIESGSFDLEAASFMDLDDPNHEPVSKNHPSFADVRRRWSEAIAADQIVAVDTVAMAPLVPAGAQVAYHDVEEDLRSLDGQMVVAWIQDQPMFRWLQNTRNYILLRVDNPSYDPQSLLIDLTNLPVGWKVRRAKLVRLPRQ